jgi:soluble lytic murein transglycosylase-like protein
VTLVSSAVSAQQSSAPSDAKIAAIETGEPTASAPDVKAQAGKTPAKSEPPVPPKLDGRANYRAIVEKEAARTGLAPEIAEAVMAVESGYNPGALGGVGEIGLMQIRPATARMLGFVGTDADLAVPETNIRYGVSYLAQAYHLAGGDLCTATMKYRAGHGETRFSFLSVNYCLAVRGKLAARGFKVTGIVPVATFGSPGGPSFGRGRSVGCGRKCVGGASADVNLAKLNTSLEALVIQVRASR